MKEGALLIVHLVQDDHHGRLGIQKHEYRHYIIEPELRQDGERRGLCYNQGMKLVEKKISMRELKQMSDRMFGGLVKAVIDIKKGIMVVDAAMHADEERILLENGSKQEDLWGINFYPELTGEDFIEFDSMINIRPQQKNTSRFVEDTVIREKITTIVHTLISSYTHVSY